VHVDFKDYLWLYLTVNRFDYIVLHQRPDPVLPEYPVRLDRIKALLRECKIYEDADTIVYDRSLLKPPTRPVHVTLGEWRPRDLWQGQWNSVIPKTGHIAIYNPDPEQDLTLSLIAAALRRAQSVRIRAGAEEVARWEVMPGFYQSVSSPPFRLPAGLQELTIESETRDLDPHDRKSLLKEEKRPYRLRIAGLKIAPTPDQAAIAHRDRENRPSSDRKTR
jgi:hypothetical protein